MKTQTYLKFALILLSITVNAQTAGTLTFTYNQPQPTSPALNKGIKNVYAVWIENGTGTFIKTKARYVSSSTDDHLPTWGAKSGCASATAVTANNNNCNVTDALTGATRTASTSPTAFGTKTITWDGKNVVGTTNGTTVVDGTYKVWVESSWNDGADNIHNEINSFSFVKGTTATHATFAGDNYLNSIVIDWVPTNLSIDDVATKEPSVVIYPVPSTGVFNLDFKNAVNQIIVYNLLGQEVFNEKCNANNVELTKKIDLSSLANGNYIISLTNDYGVSNFEVIISK